VKKPVIASTAKVPRIMASSGLVLRCGSGTGAARPAPRRPEDAREEYDAREVGAGRVRLVGAPWRNATSRESAWLSSKIAVA